MKDTCPVHDTIITDIREDIKEIKNNHIGICNEVRSKVPNRLFYVLISAAIAVSTFFGGAQLYTAQSLSEQLKIANDVTIEVKVAQKFIKQDVDAIKEHIKNGK